MPYTFLHVFSLVWLYSKEDLLKRIYPNGLLASKASMNFDKIKANMNFDKICCKGLKGNKEQY